MSLITSRPDLYEKWMEQARKAQPAIADHVKEDPVGWLLKEASSLSCYLIENEDGTIELNRLFAADNLLTAIKVLQMGAVNLADAQDHDRS